MLAAATPEPVAAAFLKPEGEVEIISSSTASGFSRGFDAAGRLRRSAEFSKASLETHVSYGFSESVTLMGEIASDRLQPRIVNDPGERSAWTALAGVRARLWHDGGAVMSAQLMMGPGFGNGRSGFAADARLLGAYSFAILEMPAFVELQLGRRWGAPGTPAELRLDATLGMRPHEDWLVLLQMFAARGDRLGAAPASFRLKSQFSLVWRVASNWSVQAGVFTTVAGINAAQESGLNLALWRRF